jgi:hypothetical protein
MTAATEAAKPDTDTTVLAIVVFGRDDTGKPHAAAFGHSDAQLAEKAAGLMGMHVLRLETDKARELAGRLPRGRVFASGRAFVPFVKAGLYDALAAFAEVSSGRGLPGAVSACTASQSPPDGPVRSEEGQGDRSPAETGNGPPSPDWEAIGLGSVVLAPAGPDDGWWEAIVVKVAGDRLTLRWRDYPDDPLITRQRHRLALLHPSNPA